MAKRRDAKDLDDLLMKEVPIATLHSIIDLVASQSWWISPEVDRQVQVVYPLTRRKSGKKEVKGKEYGVDRVWENQPARAAFLMALGTDDQDFKNFEVCHIYAEGVRDHDHYTRLANLTMLPKGLKCLSEWEPVNRVLRYHSYVSYGYTGPVGDVPSVPDHYPSEWPTKVNLTSGMAAEIVAKLRHQMKYRPQFRGPQAVS